MSKASGRLLSEYDWIQFSQRVSGYPVRRPLLPLTDHDREKIMNQLGAVMSQLSKIHFNEIGSLFEDREGNYSIGECLSPSLLWQMRDTLQNIDRGPFRKECQYFNSIISAFVAHSKELPLTPHSFFAPVPDPLEYSHWAQYRKATERWRTFCSMDDRVEGSSNRLSYCLAGKFLYEMVPSLASLDKRFVLFHPDLHLGNIFVDDDFNVTCIIDWASATTGPITELLVTPGFGGSVWPPTNSLNSAFRAGFSLGGQQIESALWDKGEMMWHFSRLVRLLSTQDYTLFKSLFQSVYQKESEDIPRLFQERSVQDQGKKLLAALCDDELMGDDEMEEQEDDDISHVEESVDHAIARKLALMSEMNPHFVADKRLWQWIESALESVDHE